MSFFVIHHQPSRIIKYSSRYKDFQYPVLFVNTTLTQVDEEEAELFLTPGLTWTTSGKFAQAEVIILFLSFLSLFGIVTQMGPQDPSNRNKFQKFRFSQSIGNCKTIPEMLVSKSGAKGFRDKALLLTFPHEKNHFPRVKGE